MCKASDAHQDEGFFVRHAYCVRETIRKGWRTLGTTNLLVNVMAIVVITGAPVIAWVTFVQPADPLEAAAVLSTDPEDRIIDRAARNHIEVTRRICMRWAAWGEVTRYFVGAEVNGIEQKLAQTQGVFLPAGCHERRRIIEIPLALAPGSYYYRSSIQFCSKRGCVISNIAEVPFFLVDREWPRQPQGAPPPVHEPL